MTDRAEQGAGSTTESRQRRRPSRFQLILIGLLAGLLCGLFLGDYAGALQSVGEAYVGLLQMTVLPYIVFSLIASIGRLSATQGKRLALISITVLAALWAIGALTVFFISFSLPSRVTGAFFSTHLIEQPDAVDFIQLFVPSNPFNSLANNVAPAVVIFCLLFGIALITVKSKEALLGHFDVVLETLIRVNSFVVALSPIGIFAITATAAGTLSFEEFGRLQAYLLTFGFSVVLLTFVVLPMLIATFTPFTYREILSVSKNALVTVFVVQSLFVVIPMLAEGVRELMDKHRKEGIETATSPEFVIPLAYPFPHLGKVLTLVFIPFAAWFYGSPMVLADYPLTIGTGLVLSFGKVVTTIPFLLNMQGLPADIFQLFLLSSVFAGGLSDLVGAMHLLAFTALTTCALAGVIRVKRTKLIALLIVTAVISSSMIFGTRAILLIGSNGTDSKAEVVLNMHLMQPMVSAQVLETAAPNPVPLLPGQSRVDRIREQGVIRIGFNAGDLPFAFYNSKGDLVGLDIDMAHRLASDLEVDIDFVPFTASTLAEQLAADHFDLATTPLPTTTRQSLKLFLSETIDHFTLALVVPERLKADYTDLETIRRRGAFTLGVAAGNIFAHQILERFPKAEIVELESESEFFEGQRGDLDALLTSAEGGSAWTLLHPFYAVVNPFPRPLRLPAGYAFAGPDPRFERLLNHWIEVQQTNGTSQELFDHWILGRGSETKGPRWSVIRDVLHWVD